MNCESVKIFPASHTDLGEVLALLSTVDLPHEGVAEHLGGFLVARDREGRLVGTIGIERYGNVGLLRSVAVSPELQRTGLGSCLTSTLLERVAGDGVEKVVLLTATARDFFARRFGFHVADRADYAEQFADSPEWELPRCSTAVCMSLGLKGDRVKG